MGSSRERGRCGLAGGCAGARSAGEGRAGRRVRGAQFGRWRVGQCGGAGADHVRARGVEDLSGCIEKKRAFSGPMVGQIRLTTRQPRFQSQSANRLRASCRLQLHPQSGFRPRARTFTRPPTSGQRRLPPFDLVFHPPPCAVSPLPAYAAHSAPPLPLPPSPPALGGRWPPPSSPP